VDVQRPGGPVGLPVVLEPDADRGHQTGRMGRVVRQDGAEHLLGQGLLAIGGDHTIAYPLLRVTRRRFGPVALVHFDAHLDTWQTYFGAPAYDHAEMTTVAAAHVAYELLALMLLGR